MPGLKIATNVMQFDMKPTVGIIARDFDKLDLDIRSFRVPLERSIHDVMGPSFQRNFDVGGRPAWAPLSEYTKLEKRRLGYGNRGILERRRTLRRVVGQKNIWSISSEAAVIRGTEQGWQRREPGRPSRTVGYYARIHQGGYSAGESKTPTPNIGLGGHKATDSYRELVEEMNRAVREGKLLTMGRAASIPARPFIVMHGDDMDDIEEIFADWLDERATQLFERGGK